MINKAIHTTTRTLHVVGVPTCHTTPLWEVLNTWHHTQWHPCIRSEPTHQSSSFPCISQSSRRCMQGSDKQYTFPSTGGDVALSCSPHTSVSDVHLAEAPLLQDSDERCSPATQPGGCWPGLNSLFFILFNRISLQCVTPCCLSLSLTKCIHMLWHGREFITVFQTGEIRFCVDYWILYCREKQYGHW